MRSSDPLLLKNNRMSSREIPTLFITLLKFIAKQPGICLTPAAVRKSAEAIRKRYGDYRKLKFFAILKFKNYSEDSELDVCQLVVKYVAESGRYTDEAIPPFFFANRKVLSLRNTKISGDVSFHMQLIMTSKL